ncbi:MAG TPA: M23 family metallopeptidase [Candidatus Acidoferrum sp.]|nr:M23 family metallopeptidase [Candidatus Acidoferrum sp.]
MSEIMTSRLTLLRVGAEEPGSPVRRMRALVAILLGIALFVSLPCRTLAQAAASGNDFAGTWKGTLGEGDNKLRIALTITKGANGEFTGQGQSVDQGSTFPLEKISVKGDAVHFEVGAAGGIYDGTLNAARTELKGTWTQGGASGRALNFVRNTEDAAKDAAAQKPPEGPKEKPLSVFDDVVVPIAPTAFKADGKWHIVYELHLNNMDRWEHRLTQIEMVSGDSAERSLVKYSGADVDTVLARPGHTGATEKSKIEPGALAIVYMWATVDTLEAVPATVRQKITVKIGTYPEELTIETAPISVGRGAIAISSPLRGDHWLAANGPSNTSGHRKALIPIDGHAAISQRFAIDWVRLRDDGKTFQGDEKDNKNYLAYGNDAVAVADGVVTETKDGIPENIPGANSRAVPITLETVGGNHVILDIGGGHFAFYAHLQPGSLRVKLGDKVRRGQVLGLVGNSGNSTEPHLHFHIENGNSPLGAEGLPYSLASFEVAGTGWGWKPADAKGPAVVHKNEMPLENEVVNFSEKP